MRYDQHANAAAGEQSSDFAAAANPPKRLTRATAAAFSASRKSSDTEESNGADDVENDRSRPIENPATVVEKTNKKAPNDTMSRQINRVLFQLNRKFGICLL